MYLGIGKSFQKLAKIFFFLNLLSNAISSYFREKGMQPISTKVLDKI